MFLSGLWFDISRMSHLKEKEDGAFLLLFSLLLLG